MERTYRSSGRTGLQRSLTATEEAPSPETAISLKILRGGKTAFSGKSSLAMMKRNFEELVEFLYRETSFPNGAFLMTGTGIVPGNDFTLRSGDEINITIDGIGTLTNPVE